RPCGPVGADRFPADRDSVAGDPLLRLVRNRLVARRVFSILGRSVFGRCVLLRCERNRQQTGADHEQITNDWHGDEGGQMIVPSGMTAFLGMITMPSRT